MDNKRYSSSILLSEITIVAENNLTLTKNFSVAKWDDMQPVGTDYYERGQQTHVKANT